ncbi:spartin, partial [Phenoliferia sp. Uapishka_3]
MDGLLLITLPDVRLDHIYAGQTTWIATGTLSLALIQSQSAAYTAVTPPPLPSRPSSPLPSSAKPPIPPRISDTSQSPQTSKQSLAPPALPPRPSSPQPAIPTYEQATTAQWLILQLCDSHTNSPLFELPIQSTSPISSQPPSYVIPCVLSYDALFGGALGNEKDAKEDEGSGFIKVTLPSTCATEDREYFEHYLLGFATLSDVDPPANSTLPPDLSSRLVLIDEEQGNIIGEVSADQPFKEDLQLSTESPDAVVVEYTDSKDGIITIRPAASAWTPTENPSGSSIISFADFISKGIVVGSEALGRGMHYGASKVVEKSKPTQNPAVFSERTKNYIGQGHKVTSRAVRISGQTVEIVGDFAAKFGDTFGKTLGIQTTSSGKQPTGIRGLVNHSLVAIDTLAGSIGTGGRTLIDAGSASSASIVGHRYGPEAQKISLQVGGSVKHAALVYIDARGVTRKALLKSVGKHAIRAKLVDGREVVLEQDSPPLPVRK